MVNVCRGDREWSEINFKFIEKKRVESCVMVGKMNWVSMKLIKRTIILKVIYLSEYKITENPLFPVSSHSSRSTELLGAF